MFIDDLWQNVSLINMIKRGDQSVASDCLTKIYNPVLLDVIQKWHK